MADVLAVISEVVGVPADKLSPSSGVGNVDGWDSLRHMELIVRLEGDLGIRFSGAEIGEMNTVAAIEAAVARHGS